MIIANIFFVLYFMLIRVHLETKSYMWRVQACGFHNEIVRTYYLMCLGQRLKVVIVMSLKEILNHFF
jgi:hypothetical protein